MERSLAYSLIERAIDSDHVPGGYLIVGDTKGNARELAMSVLEKLFPDSPEQVHSLSHPDIAWLEPEGKSSTIKTDVFRERIVDAMQTTSFSGGWKAGVIVGADRLQPTAANVFLKSLEEPTPKTIYLLLTDRPEVILPTIVSRCQRIDLALPEQLVDGEALELVKSIFRPGALKTTYAKCAAAKALADAMAELKAEAANEDVPLVRKRFYGTLLAQARLLMVASGNSIPRHLAFRNIEAIEEAYRRSEKHIPEEAILSFMLDKMTFP